MIPERPLPYHAATLARLSQSGKVTRPKPRKTAMARILMAWELGAGFGHLAPLLSLAQPLKAAGHEVLFAARDTASAEIVLGASGIPYYPAPANFNPVGGVALHSHAQILLSTAFNDVQEMTGRARAWQALYDLLRPDILVCDHAPTALLAARGRPIRCVVAGTGFVVPPDVKPFPELRPWTPVDPAVLEADEAKLLDRVNAVARNIGAPALERMGQLAGEAHHALFTLKELDNYAAARPAPEYWGPILGSGGTAPRWPEGPGKRVFFYGQPYESLETVLQNLSQGSHRVLVYIAKLPQELRERLRGPHLEFADSLLDIDAVTRECDCAVMTNGHGTTAAMLLAGKPVLLLPLHLEMLLVAMSVEQAGAGLSAPLLKVPGILGKLERLLQEPGFGASARALAERYRGKLDRHTPLKQFEALVTRLAAEA